MITHRPIIEDASKVASSNFLNKIFSTSTVNQKDIKSVPDLTTIKQASDIFNHSAPQFLQDKLKLDLKKYDLSKADLRSIIGDVFKDSPIATGFNHLIDSLDSISITASNIVNRGLILLKPFVDSLCYIMRLLDGVLLLTIPVVKLLLGILTLLRLSYEACQANLFQEALDSMDSPILRKLVTVHATHDAINSNNDSLLADITNSSHAVNLAKEYPYIANLITAQYHNTDNTNNNDTDNSYPYTATDHSVFIDNADNKRNTPSRFVYHTNPPSQEFLNILYGLTRVDPKISSRSNNTHSFSTESYSQSFKKNIKKSIGHNAIPNPLLPPVLDNSTALAIHALFTQNEHDRLPTFNEPSMYTYKSSLIF